MKPRVIAHRGASADCPENTFAAFDEALAQGCDGIELDVQLSADGVPMVYHDRTLHRVGGGRRRLSKLDATDLAHFDGGRWFAREFTGEPIPEYKEVLRRYATKTELMVEIKARTIGDRRHLQLLRAVLDETRRQQRLRRIYLLCFDWKVLREAHRIAPEVRRVLNIKPPRDLRRSLKSKVSSLHAIDANIKTLTPNFADKLHKARGKLYSYTCNTDAHLRLAKECRVSAIITDRPAWARERLDELALE